MFSPGMTAEPQGSKTLGGRRESWPGLAQPEQALGAGNLDPVLGIWDWVLAGGELQDQAGAFRQIDPKAVRRVRRH